MRIGLAQIRSFTGDIQRNIYHHLDVLSHLGADDMDLVMFPELSLSNYDPDIADSVAVDSEDIRLRPFQAFADQTGISVGVGMPIRTSGKPLISIVFFFPNQTRTVIHKAYLHEDELPYFSALGASAAVLDLSRRVAVAICYEINVDAHIESAAAKGMDIYLASVAKTAAGITEARARLSIQAMTFHVPVLVVNCVGTCEGKAAGGGSMAIASDGTVVCNLDDQEEAVLIYDVEMQDVRKLHI